MLGLRNDKEEVRHEYVPSLIVTAFKEHSGLNVLLIVVYLALKAQP